MGKIDIAGEIERQEKSAFEAEKVIEQEVKDKHMSPPGSLRLPPLLEAKRWKENIPDFYFKKGMAVYDRVLIAQTTDEDETFGGGLIQKAKVTLMRETQQSSRGVIISAGLQALDALRSNGIDIGHTVHVARMSTYAIPVGYVGGKEFRALLVHAGEICLSEDLLQAVNEGRCRIEAKDITRDGITQREHYYVDENGNVWNPVNPNFTEDY